MIAHLIAGEDARSTQEAACAAQVQGAVPGKARMPRAQVGNGSGIQPRTEEVRIDVHPGDHGLRTGQAHPVVDLPDDLTDVDQEQDLIAASGVTRKVRGEQVDALVSQDPAPQSADRPASG
ncbi:hypothetical protein K7B10_00815 [Streptomyces flavotricini]|uniref:Uncharacterized protein n=1 Tax=Streptomyces flavotricini TaxID=66888 RepID=A0ABS8DX23_9ACTN|nr:hypothetical protein [Streptomyces flavotricini]MCC0093363.1 hypothetical protein [Streptomyces flavotricini]